MKPLFPETHESIFWHTTVSRTKHRKLSYTYMLESMMQCLKIEYIATFVGYQLKPYANLLI